MINNEKKDALICDDCECSTKKESYMVHDFIWKLAHKTKKERLRRLCIGCLEDRIGFKLNYECFILAPINFRNKKQKYVKKSKRLINRLKGYSTYWRQSVIWIQNNPFMPFKLFKTNQ